MSKQKSLKGNRFINTMTGVALAGIVFTSIWGLSSLFNKSNNNTLESANTDTPSKIVLKPEIADDTTNVTSASPMYDNRYISLLSALTTKSQDYCSNNRKSLSEIKIIDITSVETKEGNSVLIKGDYENNKQFGNYIITLKNEQNTDLDIFKIGDNEITIDQFISAIIQLLSDNFTDFRLKANQRLINFDNVDKSLLLNNIAKGFNNPSEFYDLNIDTLSFSSLLASRDEHITETGCTYTYNYYVLVYGKENVYLSSFSFDSNDILQLDEISAKAKDHATSANTVCTTKSASTNNFEKILSDIKSNKIQNNTEFSNIH